MRKLFIFVFLLLVIAAIAFFIFILTFDPNKYKDMLVDKIEESIDRDVKIGNISINLSPGLAFRVDGFAIKDRDKPWDNTILRAGSIDMGIKILPLIKKDIQLKHLKLRGLEIVIDKDSLINLPRAGGHGDSRINTGIAAGGALKFLADNISIADSSVRYMDIKIDIIDALIRNVSLYGPANIKARLSVFGRHAENVNLKAMLYPEIDTGKPYIKNLELVADLGKLNVTDALAVFGKSDITGRYIDEEITGKLVVSSEKLNLDPKDIYNSNIALALSGGAITVLPIKETLNSIGLKAELKAGDVIIHGLSGSVAGGSFSAKGVIKDMLSGGEANIDVTLQGVNLAKLLPAAAPGKPALEGVFDITMHSLSTGLTEQDILDTLTASGAINIDGAKLKNMNVLTVALDKLDMLPGLVSELKTKLPGRYKELLKQNDTVFKPMALEFKIQDGRVMFQKAIIESDAFYLSASGYLGMNRDLSASSDIFIPKDLSEAFVAVVRELGYLQNSEGMITMPVDIGGKFPNIFVRPNLDYVIQKLAVAAGEGLLRSIFKKETPEDGSQPQQQQEKKGPEPEEVLIRSIIDIISGPKD